MNAASQVFTTWELVKKIFSYLPWYKVYEFRHLSPAAWDACQSEVHEINFYDDEDVDKNGNFNSLSNKKNCLQFSCCLFL